VTFFERLASVFTDLGWGAWRVHDLLDDIWWSDCFARGSSPQQAAAEARSQGRA
jgi:hypothetical protein